MRAATAVRYSPDGPPKAEVFGTEPLQSMAMGLTAVRVIF